MNTETALSVIGIIVGIIIYFIQKKPPKITIEQVISEIVDDLINNTIINNHENVKEKKFRPTISVICKKYKVPLTSININDIIDVLIYKYQSTPIHSKTDVTYKILDKLYELSEETTGGAIQSEEKDESEIIIPSGKTTESQTYKPYEDFFQQLLDELREKHAFTKAKVGLNQSGYLFPSGVKGFSYGAAFVQGGKVRVKLHIDTGEKEANKQIFNTFFAQKERIEQQFGEELIWEEFPDNRQSTISIYKTGSIRDDAESLEVTKKWMIKKLLKMKEVFSLKTKKTKKTIYQYLKEVHDELELDKEYTVEAIRGYLSKKYEEEEHEELNKNTRDLHISSAIVNEKNRVHGGAKTPLDEKRTLFYYPDENDKKIVKKFHLDIKDNPTIYWKENDQKMSKKFSEIK